MQIAGDTVIIRPIPINSQGAYTPEVRQVPRNRTLWENGGRNLIKTEDKEGFLEHVKTEWILCDDWELCW